MFIPYSRHVDKTDNKSEADGRVCCCLFRKQALQPTNTSATQKNIYIYFMHITAQLIATRMLTWRYPVNNKLNTYFTCDTRFCTTASPHQYNLQARGNKRAAMKIKTRDKTLSWIKNKHKMNEKCSKQVQLCGTQKLHAQRYRQKGDKYTYYWHVFRSDLVSLLAYSMATSTDAS